MKRNILIFHSGALGDFVLTWPLATALSRIFAQSRIIYVTAGSKGELARRVLGVEAIDSENGWHALYADDAKLAAEPAKWLAGTSLIFSFIASPDDAWGGNVRKLNPDAKVICLQPRPADNCPHHVCQFLMEQLGELPVVQQGMQQIVGSLQHRPIKTLNRSSQRMIIHPGAGALEKCWPAENYLSLIEQLQQEQIPLRVILGEAECERWPAEQVGRFQNMAETIFPADYSALLDELRQASAFIGNDSGPTHLAAIVGIPTVAIFQSTNPAQWHPLGPHVRVLDGLGPVSQIRDILSEIEKMQMVEPRMDPNEHE